MARKKKSAGNGGESYAFFKKLFEERPELATVRKNDEIFALYRAAAGLSDNAELSTTVKNNLANLKSKTKKNLEGKAGRTSRRRAVAAVASSRPGLSKLDQLEIAIDNALIFARGLEMEELAGVENALRKARNHIILMGER